MEPECLNTTSTPVPCAGSTTAPKLGGVAENAPTRYAAECEMKGTEMMIRDHGWVHESTSSPSGYIDLLLIAAAGALLCYVLFQTLFGRRK